MYSQFLVVFIIVISVTRIKSQNFFYDLTTNQTLNDCLIAQNELRKKHCAEGLKLSEKLTAYAKSRAYDMAESGGAKFAHLVKSSYGENIDWFKRKNANITCQEVIKIWYDENINYNWQKNVDDKRKAGHFTQLVWRGTKYVGCAMVFRTGINGGIFTVCNYYPWGNVARSYEKNVFSIENCEKIRKNHLMTKETVKMQQNYTSRDLTNDFWQKECLQEHNRLRRLHRVPQLIMDKWAIDFAMNRANEIAKKGFRYFRHEKNPYFNENIHWGVNKNISDPSISCKLAIKKWYNEISNYNWHNRVHHRGTIAHFINIIWNGTQRIGCGQAMNIGQPKGGTYTVCSYFPRRQSMTPDQHFMNVFPLIPTKRTTIKTTTLSVTETVKAHDEGASEADEETELEKEFKDMDDVIDIHKGEYKHVTEAPSLEEMFKSQLEDMKIHESRIIAERR